MKLIIEPEEGVKPIIGALAGAKKSIDIAIFRCDHPDIEKALVEAVKRGVTVHALIAFTNRGGETRLRGLELRLLEAGAVVARTNNDLARYHAKYIVIDKKKLLVLAFNFTKEDLRLTRSFGLVTGNASLVKEALKLFEADCARQKYTTSSKSLLVSPANARQRLTDFVSSAKKQLLIYDLDLSDPAVVAILKAQVEEGVEVRVIGKFKAKEVHAEVRAPNPLRLHARVIVRDAKELFLGSQSLRRLELDLRREVGVLVKDESLAEQVIKVFESDWESAKATALPAEKLAKKVAKAVAKEMGPIAPMIDEVAAKSGAQVDVDGDIEEVVKEAVKTAVRGVVHEAVQPPPNK